MNFIPISVDDVQPGDTIYVENTENSVPYLVLDKGVPFVMLENLTTHFCSMYRASIVYKLSN